MPTEQAGEGVCDALFPTFRVLVPPGRCSVTVQSPPPKLLVQVCSPYGDGGKSCAERKAVFPEPLIFLCREKEGRAHSLARSHLLLWTPAVIACGLLANFLRFLLITPVTAITITVNIY